MSFTFLDAFCGIGGFRLGLEAVGGVCVEALDKDPFCAQTYQYWFGADTLRVADIRDIDPRFLKDFDLLSAGFPCQPFSGAGVSKRNSMGRPHGFADADQGHMFFELMRIVEVKKPKVVFLENVEHLLSHDKGNTWAVIKNTLTDAGYQVYADVINAHGWVPQNRRRVYVVAFNKAVAFELPTTPSSRPPLKTILDPDAPSKYTLSEKLWEYLQDYKAKHQTKGNGFGYSLADPDGQTRTLSARYGKDGSEILVPHEPRPRKLTPKECARLMGFPEACANNIPVSDTQAWRQFGNAVVPLVVRDIAHRIVEAMNWS